MHTLLQPSGRASLISRIETLSSASHRQWGAMTVEEMLWHLRSQLELALGLRPTVTRVKSYLRLPPFRWLALYVIPWPKGSPTAPEMNVKKAHPDLQDFAAEKRWLLQRLQEVVAADTLHPHPLFGKLSKKDWGRLVWKHVDHHLRQFGN